VSEEVRADAGATGIVLQRFAGPGSRQVRDRGARSRAQPLQLARSEPVGADWIEVATNAENKARVLAPLGSSGWTVTVKPPRIGDFAETVRPSMRRAT
jgi:hypothetical protein